MRNSRFFARVVVLLVSILFVAVIVLQSIDDVTLSRLACSADVKSSAAEEIPAEISRSDFPENFVFGTATSSYQVEGAIYEGGRGPSIWDNFSHISGNIADGTNGDVAVDHYHHYEEDIDLMKGMHMDAYRLSISWTRIFPKGIESEPNKEGIAFYNRVFDALAKKGVAPYVTLYHWDLPQHLQDEFGGWVDRKIAGHFARFAEVCFAEFGDRVKRWITINEPQRWSWQGYGDGSDAPGWTSDRSISPVGDTSRDPYLSAHHALISHATAVDIYRKKFQAKQGGEIGMVINCEWGVPISDAAEDVEATRRHILFQLGWYLDPIYKGDYPVEMRETAKDRLPQFTPEEIALLHNSLDFVGINHYTTKFISNVFNITPPDFKPNNFFEDRLALTSDMRGDEQIGPPAFSFWLNVVPWGIGESLLHLWETYKVPIYVTENGMDTENKQSLGQPLPNDALNDEVRVSFYNEYLKSVLSAIRQGADVRGYFAWAFIDNFEWNVGYASRFGVVYCDFHTLKRYPKLSYKWFAKVLDPNGKTRTCQARSVSFRFLEGIRHFRLF